MALIGILGGMGPLATVDFMEQIIRLTGAARDQEHLPMLVANLPHTPDRSAAITDGGADPLPALLAGIDLLNRNRVGVIAVPCNSAHHWYAQMRAHSEAPLLHIGEVCAAAIAPQVTRAAVLATRGALTAGFYQAALVERGIEPVLPDPDTQQAVSACVAAVKADRLGDAAAHLCAALDALTAQRIEAAVLGCTELPIAARELEMREFALVDSTLELARETVRYALARGWNRPA
ncbi:aspartate/glutamate racemase family protein [Paraburkholderia rhizosphaerae]|uniref:Aspartate racemase n=1 Tax=Paraburkholderia rhizosphaerae TaxID=480658 RepID=A0A4R8LV61_9BURK|nr:amino acid racemase [Paraburkholderia rhizosphaerae]TDY51458.1 aspartate racemase [Paraburkholderia rhizosphaerae]